LDNSFGPLGYGVKTYNYLYFITMKKGTVKFFNYSKDVVFIVEEGSNEGQKVLPATNIYSISASGNYEIIIS
jgi:hypothetical protein